MDVSFANSILKNNFLLYFYVFLSVFLIYLIIYIISKALQSEKLERWVKGEIMDALATILLVIFITYGFMLGSTSQYITQNYIGHGQYQCGGGTVDVSSINGVYGLLNCRMANYADVIYKIQEAGVYKAGQALSRLGIFVSIIGITVFQGGYVSSWYQDLEKGRSLAIMSASILVPINALAITIKYIEANMISVFLPIGLFLRSFRLTKGLGAFFISFALSAYFIFPLSYLMLDPNYVKPKISRYPHQTTMGSCYPTMSSIISLIKSSNKNKAYTQMTLDDLTRHYSYIYSKVLLIPFIAASVTLIVTKYGTNILGGESSEIVRMAAKML